MQDSNDNQKKRKWYILDGNAISLLLVLLIAILFYVGLTNFNVISAGIRVFMGVASPFIAGFAIAYLLNTPMCFFERKLFFRFKHKRGSVHSDGLSRCAGCGGNSAQSDYPPGGTERYGFGQ